MQFVTLDTESPSALKFVFAKHIWIYFLSTGVLTALTFGIWLAYYSWGSIQERLKHTSFRTILSHPKTQTQPEDGDGIEFEEVTKAQQNRILAEEKEDQERYTALMLRISDYSNTTAENEISDEPISEERQREIDMALETISKEIKELYSRKIQRQKLKDMRSRSDASN